MNKIKKISLIFSLYFWKQVYFLFSSFITGNIWAKNNLGEYDNSTDIHPTVRFGTNPSNVFLKKNISIGYGAHIYAGSKSRIYIGEDTMIGPFVFITTEAFSKSKQEPENPHSGHIGDINIGRNVRIGAHSVLLPGVIIGDGSSIGAGSVVTGTVSENTIFAGNPAKLVKHIK